jgi:adenylate cyclase, class 2
MSSNQETEIKFRVGDIYTLTRRLRAAGFRQVTRRTLEQNTLYDLPGNPLRKRGELLRLRKYGTEWLVTHKAKSKVTRYKTRVETETKIADGDKLDKILRALGFAPTFRYEKFRAEWSDGRGHVVVDETPIGWLAKSKGQAAGSIEPRRTSESSEAHTSHKAMLSYSLPGSGKPEAARAR